MAKQYTPNFMDQDDQNEFGMPSSPGTSASVPLSSGLSGAKTKRGGSSGFTNLRNYFQANQGNKLAQTVTQPVEQKVQSAQQGLQSSEQQFAQQMASEKAKLDASRGKAEQAIQYIDTGSQPLVQNNLAQDATNEQKLAAEKTANEAAAKALSDVRDYSYRGPNQVPNQQQLVQDEFNLRDFAQASKSDAGRGAILQTMFGKGGQYTAGSRNLDNFLLSSDKQGMDKLKNIRSQTQKFGQQLKQFDTDAAAKVGAAQGNIKVIKDLNKLAMERLRDKKLADLEAEALAYNAAQKADAAELSLEELRKYAPELAGYDLVSDPSVSLPAGQVGTTAIDPNTLNYINLYKNKNFEEHQKVDPTRSLYNMEKEAGDPFQRDFKHEKYGRPNAQEAIVGLEALKPMFKETYTDNTWDSINREALERRNILSQVLADNAEKGLVTPKQRQEIQASIDNDMLSKLKELPGMAEDEYVRSFFTTGPGAKEAGQVVNNYEQMGYSNPLDLIKDMGINYGINYAKLPGATRTQANGGFPVASGPYAFLQKQQTAQNTNAFEFNPATGKMKYVGPAPTTGMYINPKTGEKVPADANIASSRESSATASQRRANLEKRGFVPETYQPPEIDPKDFINAIRFDRYGQDVANTDAAISMKYQEKYLKDKLNEILGAKASDVKMKKV